MELLFKTKDGKEFTERQEAMYHEWRLVEDGFVKNGVSAEQCLILEVVKLCNFNGFSGNAIVNFLYMNTDKWVAVIPQLDRYTLRELPNQNMFFDSLTIKPVGDGKELLKLIKKHIYPDEASIDKETGFIELWWELS